MEFESGSCVRGYHIYRHVWSPTVGQEYDCSREVVNAEDPYAVAVVCGGDTVGHVPRQISAACSLFLQRLGSISCKITGSRRYSADLPQGGLELPCIYKFRGESIIVNKLKKLLMNKCTSEEGTGDREESEPESKIIDVEEQEEKDSDQVQPWLMCRGIHLNEERDKIVLQSQQLTDRHIDFAQEMLRIQFPDILGLQSTLLLQTYSRKLPKIPKNALFLQIMHSRGNHWIVIYVLASSNIQVFDSVYNSVDEETKKLCVKIFGPEKTIEMGKCTKQEGSIDCGVHAIATCTALAHGQPPLFSTLGIRDRLILCFEKLSLTPF